MTESQKQSQLDKFKEAARELGTDDREEAFDEKLRKIARSSGDGGQNGKRI